MSEHDLKKLLGGFAADTLTAEERTRLYTATLNDQQLFNALADEQALKELLADPAIRRRLLASLEQKSPSGAGESPSWLDWFRRPAGLALAGGLTAAALAVVLGLRMYQDSLRQAAQSIAIEDATPASPPAPIPPASRPTTPQAVEPKTKENVASSDLPRKDPLIRKPALQERSPSPSSRKERTSDVARDSVKQRHEQHEVRRQSEAPVAAPSESSDEMTSSAEQKLSARFSPSAPEPKHIQTPAGGRIAGTITPALSARALFYGGEPTLADTRSTAKEQEQAMKPLTESAPRANRLERPLEGLSQLGAAALLRPLGLRYSFVVRGADGQELEVDAATASKSRQRVFLTVEANQDAYLQVWRAVGASTTQLLWPEKETGQISLKITGGQRQHIPLSMDSRPITLTTRLSRVPAGPITKHESTLLNRLSSNQLQEFITRNGTAGSQERATYVVNPDPSTSAQIAVEITLDR